ncbi:MAG TPA: FKBP-type peptidyl-prolyl cis-trans isomerase [Cellvibrionaceae bacterium]
MSSDNIENQISYGIGRQMGDQLRGNNIPGIEAAAVCEGLCDALAGKPSRLSPEQLQAAFAVLNDRLQEHQAREVKQQATAGEQFLAQNRTRPEVTTLASGLQYEVIHTGEGAKPSATNTVSTHYHGTLIDGTVFDSSVERGVPAEFPVNRVIAGWTEALQLMSVGSKWRLFIPYQLAYGERGAGGAIAPFAALIFEVELLAIVK